MRSKVVTVLLGISILLSTSVIFSQTTEDDLVQRYLKRVEKKHVTKLTWVSGYFNLNRINRNNDYNKFTTYESNNFPNASLSWLNNSKAFGINLGMVFKKRFAWSIGGEYWLKFGEELSGSYLYSPTGTNIENPSSKIKVLGFFTGLQYYFYNPPQKNGVLDNIALRIGSSIGFYQASWDLWTEYSNLNLSTNTSTGTNTTFKDNAPAFSFNLGADYPIKLFDLVLGVDMGYLYLNFNNMAWYNILDEEVVVTYTGSADGRVDLNLSGITGKIELKRFFSW